MTSTKPFDISRRRVLEAYRHVRANQGAAGIDDESIAMFEADLSRNLFKLWNRMSSGSYFPPPVKQVEIAKKSGNGKRVLGIPTVADRIGQQVVKARIEGELEGLFHPDSYGYRPDKSAADAVAVTRERCWKYDWCVEFDVCPRGWLNYYARFYRSALWRIFFHFDGRLLQWARRKYRKLKGNVQRRRSWRKQAMRRNPRLFSHWLISGRVKVRTMGAV